MEKGTELSGKLAKISSMIDRFEETNKSMDKVISSLTRTVYEFDWTQRSSSRSTNMALIFAMGHTQ